MRGMGSTRKTQRIQQYISKLPFAGLAKKESRVAIGEAKDQGQAS